MLPIDQVGLVLDGPLEGWFIKIQKSKAPSGFLVSRARNAAMDLTLILDGIFQGHPELEVHFAKYAPSVDWEAGRGQR